MEFLRELFGDQALTYEQLHQAVQSRGFDVVNAQGGAYVPKSQVDTLQGSLLAANKKLEGYDPEWKEKAAAEQQKLEQQKMDFAIESAVARAKPYNVRAVMGMLDRTKLSFAGGEVIGLDKQLADLRKNEDTAFLFPEEKKTQTGMSHEGGHEVGKTDDKKERANAALRAAFGH
jgi:hypothetical protein